MVSGFQGKSSLDVNSAKRWPLGAAPQGSAKANVRIITTRLMTIMVIPIVSRLNIDDHPELVIDMTLGVGPSRLATEGFGTNAGNQRNNLEDRFLAVLLNLERFSNDDVNHVSFLLTAMCGMN